MNTKLSYLYTDGGGHRYFAERTFAGTPEEELLQRLKRAMQPAEDEGTYLFIAEQVGLPSVFPWTTDTPGTAQARFRPEHDPPWHEVNLGGRDHVDSGILVTDERPSDGRSLEQFVRAVEQASSEGWNTDLGDGDGDGGAVEGMDSVEEVRE